MKFVKSLYLSCFVLGCFAFSHNFAMSQDAVALKNFETASSTLKDGGKHFTFEVPEDAILFTLWTKSLAQKNGLDLLINYPGQPDVPTKNSHDFACTEYSGTNAGNEAFAFPWGAFLSVAYLAFHSSRLRKSA